MTDQYIVLGASGQLGTDICKVLKDRRLKFQSLTRDELDITASAHVYGFIYHHVTKDTVVINCSAYNNVVASETNAHYPLSINSAGVFYLADAINSRGAKLIHFSTDYVFGNSDNEYLTEENFPNPCNIYGMSKYIGEQLIKTALQNHLIIRTSALYGDTPTKIKGNFLYNLWKKYQTGEDIHVYTNVYTKPTYTQELAKVVVDMASLPITGIYHVANRGDCSWHEFARHFFEYMGITDVKLHSKIYEPEIETLKRPQCSLLDTNKFERLQLTHEMSYWHTALEKYTKKIKAGIIWQNH